MAETTDAEAIETEVTDAVDEAAEVTDAPVAAEAAADGGDSGHDDHHEEHHSSLGLSNMKLAMWLFLGSECLLFAALISSYLLSKTRFITELVAGNPYVIEGTLDGHVPAAVENGDRLADKSDLVYPFTKMVEEGSVEPLWDIPFTSFSSFVLLMSSLTMVLSHSAISKGNYKNTRIWLATTALLGSVFIGGQVYEFTAFYREGLTYGGTLFGSAFYTLTGFHGVHVSGGILMLASLLFLSFRGRLQQDRAETVELVGLYWHFVDVVWVLIFTIVYLIP